MTPIIDADVARLAELLSRATPGEWKARRFVHALETPDAPELDRWKIVDIQSSPLGSFSKSDAELIAAARNLLPGLLAERERLRSACKLAYGIVQRDHRQPCRCMLCDALSFAGIATGGA